MPTPEEMYTKKNVHTYAAVVTALMCERVKQKTLND